MVKAQRVTKGGFLRATLTRTKVLLVKKWFPFWNRAEKAKPDFPAEMNNDLLLSFFTYLSKKDGSFVDLPGDVYDTKTNPGTKWIFDYIKKKLFQNEEKPAPIQAATIKKKPSPQKSAVAKADQTPKDAENTAVQIEADGHLHLGDEKKMAFRKDMELNSDIDAKPPSDSSFEGVTTEHHSVTEQVIEEQHKVLKDLFCRLVNTQPKVFLHSVSF